MVGAMAAIRTIICTVAGGEFDAIYARIHGATVSGGTEAAAAAGPGGGASVASFRR
jgi:hypothetical protein